MTANSTMKATSSRLIMHINITAKIEIHHHHVGDSEVLNMLRELGELLMATMQDITDKVEALKTVEDSVVALLTELSAMVRAIGTPAQAQAVADKLDAQKQALADAVTANTPAA